MRSRLSGARRRVAFGRSRRITAGHPDGPVRAVEPDPCPRPADPSADRAAPAEVRSRDMLPRSTAPRREFRLEHSSDGRRATITPVGELDGASVIRFEETLAEIVPAARSIVLDLRRLTFIDSSGLWAITLVHRTCKRRGVALCLMPGPENVQNVFEVTGLYDLLPFAEPGATVAPATL